MVTDILSTEMFLYPILNGFMVVVPYIALITFIKYLDVIYIAILKNITYILTSVFGYDDERKIKKHVKLILILRIVSILKNPSKIYILFQQF